MESADEGSSSSGDTNWFISPVGPFAQLIRLQEGLFQETAMAYSAFRSSNNERSRLKRRGGSIPGRSPNIKRSFEEFHRRYISYYFTDQPRFGDRIFRQRFRCRKALFLRAVEKIAAHDDYFQQRSDAAGRLGMTPLHKVIVAWRKICYGYVSDGMDESFEVSASTNRQILDRFCDASIELWEKEFIRRPNAADIKRISTHSMLCGTDVC